MAGHYEIQTRRKGAWLPWVSFREGSDRARVDAAWASHCATGRNAARLVFVSAGRNKILSTKQAGHA